MALAGVLALFFYLFIRKKENSGGDEASGHDGIVFFRGEGIETTEHFILFNNFQNAFSPVDIDSRYFNAAAEHDGDAVFEMVPDVEFLFRFQRKCVGMKAVEHSAALGVDDIIKKRNFFKIHKKTSLLVAYATEIDQ